LLPGKLPEWGVAVVRLDEGAKVAGAGGGR
jgi:hypothetical protein